MKAIFPKTQREFNAWLKALPPRTKFNVMEPRGCPCARFAQKRAGVMVSFAAPDYTIIAAANESKHMLAPPWTTDVQQQAFNLCSEKNGSRHPDNYTSRSSRSVYSLTAGQLVKHLGL